MITGDLQTAATWAGGRLASDTAGKRFRGLSTDSRALAPGELFVALSGPNFDGHAFLADAAGGGAAGGVVEHGRGAASMPCIEVDDTLAALGALGAAWRQRFGLPVIAVTGSNGKTTVKECLAAILCQCGAALASRGNLNNRVGVPLMLAELDEAHQAAVFELASNYPGEIATLARLVRPGVGVITNGHPAHLAGFGTPESAAEANGELFAGLGDDGVAVLPADDPWFARWRGLAGSRRIVTFGTDACAEVHVRVDDGAIVLTVAGETHRIGWRLPGEHNRRNAAAAAAAAWAAGFEPRAIAAGLQAVEPVAGRLVERAGVAGAVVYDDSYNANPGSFDAALAVLAQATGRRWAVVGEMAELGDAAIEAHRDLGRRARESGVERLWALGSHAAATCEGFGTGAEIASDRTELGQALAASLSRDVALLVKGSRSNRLEGVVAAVVAASGGSEGGAPCC